MASCRDQIAQELVARLGAISGWTVARGDRGAPASNVPVLAMVYQIGENKTVGSTEHYACTLRLGVILRSGIEHASPTVDGGNGQRYLDRLITLAEQAVHSADWPDQVLQAIEGHEIAPPGESSVLEALVSISFQYRHQFDDPGVFL